MIQTHGGALFHTTRYGFVQSARPLLTLTPISLHAVPFKMSSIDSRLEYARHGKMVYRLWQLSSGLEGRSDGARGGLECVRTCHSESLCVCMHAQSQFFGMQALESCSSFKTRCDHATVHQEQHILVIEFTAPIGPRPASEASPTSEGSLAKQR